MLEREPPLGGRWRHYNGKSAARLMAGDAAPCQPRRDLPAATAASAFATGAGSEADLLGQLAALAGIVGGDHGVVRRLAPALAVLLRRHVVGRLEVALQPFTLLAVFQSDDEFRGHRLLDWHPQSAGRWV